jgi:hypothetical protein
MGFNLATNAATNPLTNPSTIAVNSVYSER